MEPWASNLFYVIFLVQIIVISYYIPEKLLGRMKHVLETYPPSEYPKLYPKPVEHYRIGHWLFKAINRTIFVLGFVILAAMIFVVDHGTFADDGYISEAWPAAYGVLQFLPLILLEVSEFNHLKLMRQANSIMTRKAELHPRRLFDFVSPVLFGLAVLLYLAALLFDFFTNQLVFRWSMALVLTVTMFLIVVVGARTLHGKKRNPHQAPGDRTKQIGVQLKALLYSSMALSVVFMTFAADRAFNLDFLDATIMSLYFQVVVLLSIGHALRSFNPEALDFEVYRGA